MALGSALQIAQATVGTGAVGESWKGGSSADAGGGLTNTVTITNTAPETANTTMRLLWVPHDGSGVKLDVAGEGQFSQDSAHVWSFKATAGVWGKWVVEAEENVGGTIKTERRVFGIASPVHGLFEPAFNEQADPDAFLPSTAAKIAASWDNEGGSFNGWQKDLRRLIEITETLGGGGGGFSVDNEAATNTVGPTTIATITPATDNRSYTYWGVISAKRDGSAEQANWQFMLSARRDGGTVVGAEFKLIHTYKTAGAATWDVDVNEVSPDLFIQATGEAAVNIRWRVQAFETDSGAAVLLP